jgi:uncharacterized protein (TIGR02246 family)
MPETAMPESAGTESAGSGFDDDEIEAAVNRLAAALQADDPTAWVYDYTEDAVFDGGGDHVVRGRAALLDMARDMTPMREVSIRRLRTDGCADLATVWFEGSWTNGPAADAPATHARGLMLLRREADGQWRVAVEQIGRAPGPLPPP